MDKGADRKWEGVAGGERSDAPRAEETEGFGFVLHLASRVYLSPDE